MSYDLMVFDPNMAPAGREPFMNWFRAQTQWKEEHGYSNPSVPAPKLRAWWDELRKDYPPMNGSLASKEADDPRVTDYSLGRSIIYAAFAWSEAKNARKRTFDLARKHAIGFFDVSAKEGGVWAPTAAGKYECIHGRSNG